MTPADNPTDDLLERAAHGDRPARDELLRRHRERLCRMVAVRMDRRLTARVDPSDVVQEALADADARLNDYLRRRPLPFVAWLRQLAWERLLMHHRRHLFAQKRSVRREESEGLALPDESALELAHRLVAAGSSPSQRLVRQEVGERVRLALTRLADADREVLVLRHLEQLPMAEIAAVLGLSEGAVKVRHLRALRRFRELLGDAFGEDVS